MKRLLAISVIFLTALLFSCNSNPAKEETKPTDTTTTAEVTPKVETPTFTPFKVLMIQHKVKDFGKSVAGYFGRDSLRAAAGITHYLIGRALKDSNTVFVVDKIDDVERAKAFYNLSNTKELMKKAGVSSAPGYTYAEMIRNHDATTETPVELAVTYYVKDFDSWLKAFDAEGASTRAANGLIDNGMARNLNDSSTVSVLFAVSDLEKAKARMSSPEAKKFMTDAGVINPPTTRWYRVVK